MYLEAPGLHIGLNERYNLHDIIQTIQPHPHLLDEWSCEHDEWSCEHDEWSCEHDEWSCEHDEWSCEHDEWSSEHDEWSCEHDEWSYEHDEWSCDCLLHYSQTMLGSGTAITTSSKWLIQ